MSEPVAPLLVVHRAPAEAAPALERARLVRRARLLAWLGLAWHAVEAAVAIGAGSAAPSPAPVGFGAGSVAEGVAGIGGLWRFAAARAASEEAERRAQRLIGASFVLIAAFVAFEAVRALAGGHEPEASWVGIALSVATLATMTPLAIAKGRLGARLGSGATSGEGRQNMLCAYLSAALLVGLVANAALGWWWADPVAALLIAGVALRGGRETWRGEDCGCGVAGGCC